MSTLKAGWYVIYTKPRHEKKIAEYLKRSELEYFLPLIKKLRTLQGRKKIVQLPLFPSYVFIKLDTLQHYFDTLHIPGVLYYVRNGGSVAQVNEIIIQKLQRLILNNAYENIEVSSEHFSKSNIINIQTGPFKGFLCEIIKHNGRFKVLVRIELLQRNLIVDLPSCCLDYNQENYLSRIDKFHLQTIPAN
jgi:transcription antitermination factor NusG